MIKKITIQLMRAFNISLKFVPFLYKKVLPNGRENYRPFFQPWLIDKEFLELWKHSKNLTTSSIETFYFIYSFAKNLENIDGIFCECGVYKGGTARMLSAIANKQRKDLHLFDTFAGMPEQSKALDFFKVGSFSDTSLSFVQSNLSSSKNIFFHQGKLPDTLVEINNKQISFAHIDVDQYQSTKNTLEMILQSLVKGGLIIVDDYGRPSTPGAKLAVDEVCIPKNLEPIALPTGQCVILNT